MAQQQNQLPKSHTSITKRIGYSEWRLTHPSHWHDLDRLVFLACGPGCCCPLVLTVAAASAAVEVDSATAEPSKSNQRVVAFTFFTCLAPLGSSPSPWTWGRSSDDSETCSQALAAVECSPALAHGKTEKDEQSKDFPQKAKAKAKPIEEITFQGYRFGVTGSRFAQPVHSLRHRVESSRPTAASDPQQMRSSMLADSMSETNSVMANKLLVDAVLRGCSSETRPSTITSSR